MELLEKANAKATFFLLGKHIDQNRDLARKIIEKGHLIGEHSYYHTHPWKCNPIISANDLIKGWKSVRKIDKKFRSKYFRPPYGKFNLITFIYILFWRKKVVFWTEDPKDYMITNIDTFLENDLGKIKTGSVVLIHDGRARRDENPNTTIDALQAILEKSDRYKIKCQSVDNIY